MASLLDRLRHAGKQLPPSHIIDNPHDFAGVLSALALYLEHGEAVLTAAESNDPNTGLEMALHQHANQVNQAEWQRQAQLAAQQPQVQFTGGPIIPGQPQQAPAFATQTGAAGAFQPPPAYQPPPSIFGAPPQPQSTPYIPEHPPAAQPQPQAPQGQPGPVYVPPAPQAPQGFALPPQPGQPLAPPQPPAPAQFQQAGGPQLQPPGPVFSPNPGGAQPDAGQQLLYQLLAAAQGMAADQGHAGRVQLADDLPPAPVPDVASVPGAPSAGAEAPSPPSTTFDAGAQFPHEGERQAPAPPVAQPGVPNPDDPLGGEAQ